MMTPGTYGCIRPDFARRLTRSRYKMSVVELSLKECIGSN